MSKKTISKRYRKYFKFKLTDIEKIIEFDKCTLYKHFPKIKTIIKANRRNKYLNKLFSNIEKYTNDEESRYYSIDITIYKALNAFLFKIEKTKIDSQYTGAFQYVYYIHSLDEECTTIHHNYLPGKITHINQRYDIKNIVIIEYYNLGCFYRKYGPACLRYAYMENVISKLRLDYTYTTLNKKYPYQISWNYKDLDNMYFEPDFDDNKCQAHNIYFENNKPKTINIGSKEYGIQIQKKYAVGSLRVISQTTSYYTISYNLSRLNGPALITEEFQDYGKYVKNKQWFFKDIELPNDVPKIENDKPLTPLTKSDILKSILFDREYGAYIKKLYEEQNSITVEFENENQ